MFRRSLGLITYITRQITIILIGIFFIYVAHADDWRIDDNENFITLSKNGEIQHGNNIYFSFHKQNRCLFDVFFFIYTMQDIQNPLIEIYEDQNIDLIFGGSPIPALLNYSSEFALGQLVGIYVAREVPLSQQFIDMTEDMLQDNFMKMEITGKHLQYFDMPDEQWDFTNIETHLNKAHSRCVSQLLLSQ